MTPAQLTALGSTLALLGFISLIWAASWLVSDKRARRKAEPRKHVTIVDSLSADPLTGRWCAQCAKRVADNHNEHWLACPRCGGPLSRVSLVVAAIPTPDEPDTLPDGTKGAA